MKKIYLLSSALLLVLSALSQNQERPDQKEVVGTRVVSRELSVADRTLQNPDTLGLVNYTDFLPEFFPATSGGIYYYSWDYPSTVGGYYFGNNRNGWNVWAQGYSNLNGIPVKVIGALIWFAKKESDLTTNSNSVVTIGAYPMSANKACNTTGTGTYNGTVLNSIGPNTIAPAISATIPFSAIDTINENYVAFASPPTYTGDFAISLDTRTLVAGDTIGILADDWTTNDGNNLDLNFVLSNASGGRWVVIDNWGSNAAAPDLGSGGFDLNLSIFPVVSDATGVNEFFNGVKLNTYPNPAIEKATIEYTLEKNSGNVKLLVLDANGRRIIENEYGSQAAGTYKVNVELAVLAAGTYFYQLRANGHVFTKQLIISK